MLKDIRNFLNGSVYGIILIIPGISATLFAIILKFYEELIGIVNHFREDFRKNVRYLGVFLLGVIAGTVLFSSLVVFLLENHPFPTMLFFTGLLAGMIPLVAAKARGPIAEKKLPEPRKIVLAAFSLLVLFAASRLMSTGAVAPAEALAAANAPLLLSIFLAGIINGATLVIPGLSGAFILLIMGLYPLVIFAISSVGDFLLDMGNVSLLRNIAIVLLPFGTGALLGLLGMARIMEKLMRDFPEEVYAVILGLLLGSLVVVVKDLFAGQEAGAAPLAAGVLTFCAGCAAAYVLGKRE
ncbi:MAG: DUF368 domain-containing protein [Treponema sp.]|nr:DUF368 domain-containing protein [Treponema sp.]